MVPATWAFVVQGPTNQLLAGLLHWFGLPEPAQVRSDGTLVPRQFTMSWYREAEAWATANDVNAERLGGT